MLKAVLNFLSSLNSLMNFSHLSHLRYLIWKCFSLTLTLVLIFFYGNGYVENNYIDYKTKGNKMGNYNNLSQTSMSQITIILVTMTLTLAMMTLRKSVMSKVKTSSRHHSLSNPGVNVKNIGSPLTLTWSTFLKTSMIWV